MVETNQSSVFNIVDQSELSTYLVIDVVETKDADGVDVLLSAARAPAPVITGSNPWEGVAQGIFSPRHPLLLLRKKIILPNLQHNHQRRPIHDTKIIGLTLNPYKK